MKLDDVLGWVFGKIDARADEMSDAANREARYTLDELTKLLQENTALRMDLVSLQRGGVCKTDLGRALGRVLECVRQQRDEAGEELRVRTNAVHDAICNASISTEPTWESVMSMVRNASSSLEGYAAREGEADAALAELRARVEKLDRERSDAIYASARLVEDLVALKNGNPCKSDLGMALEAALAVRRENAPDSPALMCKERLNQYSCCLPAGHEGSHKVGGAPKWEKMFGMEGDAPASAPAPADDAPSARVEVFASFDVGLDRVEPVDKLHGRVGVWVEALELSQLVWDMQQFFRSYKVKATPIETASQQVETLVKELGKPADSLKMWLLEIPGVDNKYAVCAFVSGWFSNRARAKGGSDENRKR